MSRLEIITSLSLVVQAGRQALCLSQVTIEWLCKSLINHLSIEHASIALSRSLFQNVCLCSVLRVCVCVCINYWRRKQLCQSQPKDARMPSVGRSVATRPAISSGNRCQQVDYTFEISHITLTLGEEMKNLNLTDWLSWLYFWIYI